MAARSKSDISAEKLGSTAVAELLRIYKKASARCGRARFTRAAAVAAGDSWKDSDVTSRVLHFDLLAISQDEGAKFDYDEDGGYS